MRSSIIWYGCLVIAVVSIPILSHFNVAQNWEGAIVGSIVLLGWITSTFRQHLCAFWFWKLLAIATIMHVLLLWILLDVILGPNTRIGNFWWAPVLAVEAILIQMFLLRAKTNRNRRY